MSDNMAMTLAPKNLDEAIRWCELMSRSNFVPAAFSGKPGDILAAIQYGYELGIGPMQALRGIKVISGKPSMDGDLMLAIAQGSGEMTDFQEYVEGEGDQRVGVCIVKRKNFETPFEERFGVMDAKRAGLWDKTDVWKKYPQRMLVYRARGFCLRRAFQDRLAGVISAEEASDYPTNGAKQVDVQVAAPPPVRLKRASELGTHPDQKYLPPDPGPRSFDRMPPEDDVLPSDDEYPPPGEVIPIDRTRFVPLERPSEYFANDKPEQKPDRTHTGITQPQRALLFRELRASCPPPADKEMQKAHEAQFRKYLNHMFGSDSTAAIPASALDGLIELLRKGDWAGEDL